MVCVYVSFYIICTVCEYENTLCFVMYVCMYVLLYVCMLYVCEYENKLYIVCMYVRMY